MSEAPEGYDAVLEKYRKTARIKSIPDYEELYRKSLSLPEEFWGEKAGEYLSWEKRWDFVLRFDMEEAEVEWFGGGVLNAAYNCVDRHAEKQPDKTALLRQGDAADRSVSITYEDLRLRVTKVAAALKARGVERGDRVVLHLPAIVELPVAMLACARIGAVHCAVSEGYGAEALTYRINDCKAKVVVTADAGMVSGEEAPLKPNVDSAVKECPSVETILVVKRSEEETELEGPGRTWWHEAIEDPSLPASVPPEPMGAEDPLFILYVGGGTGKPKGLVHTHGGYLLHAAMTTSLILDMKDDGVLWLFEDTAWISGHTYAVYGPLLNGLTSVIFEGSRESVDRDRLCSIISKNNVDTFCTLPATVRSLMAGDGGGSAEHAPSSLKLLALTEEIADESVWNWFYEKIGGKRCPVVDAYCQSEAGGFLIAPLPGVDPVGPGSCGRPFFGVEPVILDPDTGDEVGYPDQEGVLCLSKPWPGIARTVFGDHERFLESCFNRVPGLFFTGDGAKRDQNGYYRITGRIDDVINTAGRRLGIPELESVLVGHEMVTEAAVVGFPHYGKGRGVYAFVHPAEGAERSDAFKEELRNLIRTGIGGPADLDVIQWTDTLPRTPSGKLLRVVLQRIAAGDVHALGDAGVPADAEVIESLVKGRLELVE
jgi:acetyl-CoA synthetase